MDSENRGIHGGLLLAGGLLAASLSVLILGAARGQATDAGLSGSVAARFTLKDATGNAHAVGGDARHTTVLVVAPADAALPLAGREVRQLCGTLGHDAAVRVLGVQVAVDVGLLADTVHAAGVLERDCPELQTVFDVDASVARAYRVSDVPTAFVIDDHAVVRARVPLDHDGAAVAVAETVNSLRPALSGLGASASPALPR